MAQATAKSNVELLEDGYKAFNEGDIESVSSLMNENIEWIEPEGLPFGGTHHGPEAVAENVFGPVMDQFESLELDVERFIDGGDTVVALGTAHGTIRETGTELNNPFAHVYDFEDGQIARFAQYTNTYLWLDAIEA